MQQIRHVAEHALIFAVTQQELLNEWLDERLGNDYRFDVDLTAGRIDFSSDRGTISARPHVVASIARTPATILWGFHEFFAGRVPADAPIHHVRAFGEAQGLAEFSDGEIAYPFDPETEDQGQAISRAGHLIGIAMIEIFGPSFHYYIAPSGGSVMVLLLEQWSEAPPRVDLTSIMVRLARLVPTVSDLGWALGGLPRLLPGWSVADTEASTPGASAWRLADEVGRWCAIEVTRDDLQRITNMRVQGPFAQGNAGQGS